MISSYFFHRLIDFSYKLLSILINLTIYYYYEYKDEELKDKIESLFLYDFEGKAIYDKMASSYVEIDGEWVSEGLEDLELSSDEIYEIYKYLFQLNKEFAVSIKKLNDISNYFDKEEDRITSELDMLTLRGKKEKVKKNYFILISILAQILSLMSLLFLFRNLIKERL